ncbi:MAG: alkaline phosphatase [Firmicutes bacterium]|nr:alkaline phosphatase [Bacillota bacterium]
MIRSFPYRLLLGLLVLTILAAPLFTVLQAVQAASPVSIRILPIDRAKFLAGQTFDLRVETSGLSNPVKTFSVKINGVAAEDFFQRYASRTESAAGAAEYTLRGISFPEPGNYDVQALVETESGSFSKTVHYQVLQAGSTGRAKNVILFIGDGLSLPIRTAARVVSRGLTEGKTNSWLEMDAMEVAGFITTSGMDSLVTDSANSASAYATGHKSVVNAMGVYPDNTTNTLDDPRVENIIELAKRVRGMSTGLITTSDITDATPAAMFGHTRRRSDSLALVDQMLEDGRRPDVILGGGSKWFLPKSIPGSKRKDERNVLGEFEKLGYTLAGNNTDLTRLDPKSQRKVLGLFNLGNMNVYIDKRVTRHPEVLGNFPDQPVLWDMTQKAIDILSQNPQGFFLMVEGASIDKQAHALDWERTVWDTIEMDKAVGVAKAFAAKNPDTLIIVVADHSHGMSITGTYTEKDGKKGREAVRVYANAGFPTFTYQNGDGFPDQVNPDVTLAIGWGNHPDYYEDYKFNPTPLSPAVMVGGKAIANPKRDSGGELRSGNLPSNASSEVHTADDVPLTASGPGSEYLSGVKDNTEVFFAMVQALGLDARQNEVTEKSPRLIFNGRPITLEYGLEPRVADGRFFIPLRAVLEPIGATVTWDATTQSATARRGSREVTVTINKGEAMANGKPIVMGTFARLIAERTFVPAELLGELGYQVTLDEAMTKAVISGQ